ncbi:unknown [Euproctis pseudoconspersa nucleopolyhedrovirus]|uniref:Uncharacterized protein n=1 Tax=Euproctis pseudoconspersa nucleopolyhedrovirus TaxID=307467 RepID=C3TX24_9ABAC|nr:hypothetical protein EupsNPV_gp116 [Euproctis pseudoconspersa nucleopolyhedrovirus]ACO53566.1 unknown [Euproctis pseudoconspersa nucleopolyhedrovirus]
MIYCYDFLITLERNHIFCVQWPEDEDEDECYEKIDEALMERLPPHVNDFLYKRRIGWDFITYKILNNSEMHKNVRSLGNYENDNSKCVVLDDIGLNLLVEAISELEPYFERVSKFVDELSDYITTDLDLPYYKGKDFYRQSNTEKNWLAESILNDKNVLEWLKVPRNLADYDKLEHDLDAVRSRIMNTPHDENYDSWANDVLQSVEQAVNETLQTVKENTKTK